MHPSTQSSFPHVLSQRSGSIIAIGAVFTALGIFAIVLPAAATLAVELLIGWLLLVSGISGLVFSWHMRVRSDWWMTGLVAALTTVLGLIFLLSPRTGIASLTLLIVALFLVEGVFTVAWAFRLRGVTATWSWIALSGAMSIVVALLIWSGWPGSSAWAIGLLVGINFLSTGVSILMLGLALRALRNPRG
jgi:uncharacterized membrane protein HdeD (DUF308 family)